MATEREAIIKALQPYFHIKELVCPHTYEKFGNRSWQFLDTDLLYCLLILRETVLCKPIIVNYKGHTQRGLRCNRCELVKGKATVYLSAHCLGKAIDFNVEGMSASEARRLIIENASKFPCQIRLEDGTSWVHFDVIPTYGNSAKVYVFKP